MTQELLKKQAVMWGKLGRLFANGVPVLQAMELVIGETDEPSLQEALRQMRDGIRQGLSLHEAMEAHPDLFPRSMCAIVHGAELGGEVDKALFEIRDGIEAGEFSFAEAAGPEEPPPEVESDPTGADRIVRDAADQHASDVHFIPSSDGGVVKFRIDGVLHDRADMDRREYDQCIRRLKIRAGACITDKGPQEGRFYLQEDSHDLQVRLTSAPALRGETVVLRLFDNRHIVPVLEEAVPLPRHLNSLERWMAAPNGFALVTGKTGSGKTSIFYALLQRISQDPHVKIMTVERPVEIQFEGMVQFQVNQAQGLSYSRLLQTVTRQDPDVIAVGDVADPEIVEQCLALAETGHLVMGTTPANTATQVCLNLLELQASLWPLRDLLLGISNQRLARVLCSHCREEYTPDPAELEQVPGNRPRDLEKLFRGRGCEKCNGTGYRGRLALLEIFEPDQSLWQQIRRGMEDEELRRVAREHGFQTLWDHGIELVREGKTTLAEVRRVLSGITV